MEGGIKTFQDLIAWQKASELALSIYEVSAKFPSEEKFGLTSQIRRAAISISSNIAEGFSRNSAKDKAQFYAIAKGSASEVLSQLLVAKALGYAGADTVTVLERSLTETMRLISGLIKSSDRI